MHEYIFHLFNFIFVQLFKTQKSQRKSTVREKVLVAVMTAWWHVKIQMTTPTTRNFVVVWLESIKRSITGLYIFSSEQDYNSTKRNWPDRYQKFVSCLIAYFKIINDHLTNIWPQNYIMCKQSCWESIWLLETRNTFVFVYVI